MQVFRHIGQNDSFLPIPMSWCTHVSVLHDACHTRVLLYICLPGRRIWQSLEKAHTTGPHIYFWDGRSSGKTGPSKLWRYWTTCETGPTLGSGVPENLAIVAPLIRRVPGASSTDTCRKRKLHGVQSGEAPEGIVKVLYARTK